MGCANGFDGVNGVNVIVGAGIVNNVNGVNNARGVNGVNGLREKCRAVKISAVNLQHQKNNNDLPLFGQIQLKNR